MLVLVLTLALALLEPVFIGAGLGSRGEGGPDLLEEQGKDRNKGGLRCPA